MTSKRRKTNTGAAPLAKGSCRGRSKYGILEGIPEMPLDILFMIFTYLTPLDMLNLARTTKLFRRFLMTSSAARLWRIARLNVEGLPNCPPHLSEPAYANLAFYNHCHLCDKANVKTVFWALGARYCPGCREGRLFKCKRRRRCCSFEGNDLIVPVSEDSSSSYHYHRNDELPIHARQHFDALNDEAKEMHKLRVKHVMNWARECEIWNHDIARSRENELLDIRLNRLHAIIAKLRDLGWDEELGLMYPDYKQLRNHPDVSQSRPLTDRIWNNVRHHITELMEGIRRQRLEAERLHTLIDRCHDFQVVYRGWHAKQKNKRILPRAIELMRRPEVRVLITQENEQQVSKADFEAFTECFAEWTGEWKTECDEKLRELVRNSPVFQDRILTDIDPLWLATVVFTCKKCQHKPSSADQVKILPLYPTILTHDCLYEEVRDTAVQDIFERAMISVSQTKALCGKHTFWSCAPLEVDRWARRAENIITAFGKDPMTATRVEMDAIDDARIYCFGCPLDSIYHRDVMNWRHALRHYAAHDAEKPSIERMADGGIIWNYKHQPSWAKITDSQLLQVVRQTERKFAVTLSDEYEQFFMGPWYNCVHCPRGDLTPIGLFQHSKWSHGLEEPQEGDFYRCPDAEMSLLRSTLLVHPSFKAIMTDSHRIKVDSGMAAWFDFRASAPDSMYG